MSAADEPDHAAFFAEVRAEFDARRADNLTEATDDAQTLQGWLSYIAWVVSTMRENPAQVRRCLVKLAALALAAAEAHDRRARAVATPGQSGGAP